MSCTSACVHLQSKRLLEQLHMQGSAACRVWAEDWDFAAQAAEAGAKEKKSVTPAMTLAHMPQHANSLGITFGGQVGMRAMLSSLAAVGELGSMECRQVGSALTRQLSAVVMEASALSGSQRPLKKHLHP